MNEASTCAQFLQQLEAAHVQQPEVEHHAIERLPFDGVERLLPGRDGSHVHVVVADQIHDTRTLDLVVLDDEQLLDAPLDERADVREGVVERLARHRLRQLGERALPERALRLVGDRNDVHGDVACGGIVLEAIEHLPPVSFLQLNVERDCVRAIPVRQRHRRVTARGDDPAESLLPGRLEENRRERLIFFDDQHDLVVGSDHVAIVGDLGRQLSVDGGRERRRPLQVTGTATHGRQRRGQAAELAGQHLASLRQVQHERAALVHSACQPDFAAEQPRQLAADRQAEARAAVLPVRRAVHLLKRLENDLVLLRRDADARVSDGPGQHAGRDRERRMIRRPAGMGD